MHLPTQPGTRITNSFFILAICLLASFASLQAQSGNQRQFYEIKIYHYSDTTQEGILDRYLEKAYLPALSRKGITQTGVFKALTNDTSAVKSLYIIVPFNRFEQTREISLQVAKDPVYQAAATEYTNAAHKSPPYTRMESILLYAFSMAPVLQAPNLKSAKSDRVYELRSYESATEKTLENKIRMFNEGGETALFNRLGFNASFYGEVISGPRMPNLMYMTCFENKEERDAHWKAFGGDPEWKKLSAMPEYQNNVSHIDIIFVRPTMYSAW